MTRHRLRIVVDSLIYLAIIAAVAAAGFIALAARAAAAESRVVQDGPAFAIEFTGITNGSAWVPEAGGACAPDPLIGTRLPYAERCESPRWSCLRLDGSDLPPCAGLAGGCWCGVLAYASADDVLAWPWPEGGVAGGVMVLSAREVNTAPDAHPMLEWAGPGDWTRDGAVDVFDLLAYLDEWFAAGRPVEDLLFFVGEWFDS